MRAICAQFAGNLCAIGRQFACNLQIAHILYCEERQKSIAFIQNFHLFPSKNRKTYFIFEWFNFSSDLDEYYPHIFLSVCTIHVYVLNIRIRTNVCWNSVENVTLNCQTIVSILRKRKPSCSSKWHRAVMVFEIPNAKLFTLNVCNSSCLANQTRHNYPSDRIDFNNYSINLNVSYHSSFIFAVNAPLKYFPKSSA